MCIIVCIDIESQRAIREPVKWERIDSCEIPIFQNILRLVNA